MLIKLGTTTIVESDKILAIESQLRPTDSYLRVSTIVTVASPTGIQEVTADISIEEVSTILYNAGLLDERK